MAPFDDETEGHVQFHYRRAWPSPQTNMPLSTMSWQTEEKQTNKLRQARKQHVRQPLELLRLWLFSLSCGGYGFWVG